jgi:glycosyltransferase involved in cell wall biosynthesis
MNFSVLMSVYRKEIPSFLEECLVSLQGQTLQATEIVLVQDGPLTPELGAVIERFSKHLPIKSVKLETNKGLATALNVGLTHCSHELVARMDTDDVALPERFEKQIRFMHDNPEIDVVSSWIEERGQKLEPGGFLKRVPARHEEIIKFSKRRNPINHPASVYRKSSVLAVGGYPLIFPEDYALWSCMLVKGYRFANMQQVLLHMRTGDDFIVRRGLGFLKGELGLLRFQRSIGFLGLHDLFIYLMIRAVVRSAPSGMRKLFYAHAR